MKITVDVPPDHEVMIVKKDKPKVLISFVLDMSGSMVSQLSSTIRGFNEFLREHKISGLDADFSLCLFDSKGWGMTGDRVRIEKRYRQVPINQVANLSYQNYKPGGGTPLYDAIGHAINDIGGGVYDRVLFVIMTDGCENSSVTFNQSQIFQLINFKKELGWEFIFLGADQDAYSASGAIGIGRAHTISYNSKFTGETFAVSSNSSLGYLSGAKETAGFTQEQKRQTGDPSS